MTLLQPATARAVPSVHGVHSSITVPSPGRRKAARSNATVAVLIVPMAVALAEALGVSPRPFTVAVMMAGSAAFATPFGYQTNVLVFQIGGYSYMDFVRVGLPLKLITWATAMVAIPYFFPF